MYKMCQSIGQQPEIKSGRRPSHTSLVDRISFLLDSVYIEFNILVIQRRRPELLFYIIFHERDRKIEITVGVHCSISSSSRLVLIYIVLFRQTQLRPTPRRYAYLT